MPETPHQSESLLTALRHAGGHASSPQLQQALGLSQPTVSRLLAPLIASGQILKAGAARAQRYLLPRHVEGVGSSVTLREVSAEGVVGPFGILIPLHGGRFWMEEVRGHSALHPGLPWFLYDMRPQGFLGRGFSLAHPELALPASIDHWHDDHILKALVHMGDDLPGNLIVGEPAFARYPSRAERFSVANHPEQDYPALALQTLQRALPGSSAGGEQPKFSAVSQGHAVLVKFSPAGNAPADERWRDLLVCECLALDTLAQGGIAAAQSQIVQAGGRVFLQSRRFDRTPQGRKGMVSLETYDSHYIGLGTNWVATAQRVDMAGSDRLQPADVRTLCLLDAYGALIANTDRHHGNISLLLQDNDWQLSPTYDMLPMFYAPINGEVAERSFGARPPQPSEHTLPVWEEAKALASHFWQTAAADERISSEFRAIANDNLQLVTSL